MLSGDPRQNIPMSPLGTNFGHPVSYLRWVRLATSESQLSFQLASTVVTVKWTKILSTPDQEGKASTVPKPAPP